MEDHETVKVYASRIFDQQIGAMRHATCKASREMIASSLGGEVWNAPGKSWLPVSWTSMAAAGALRRGGAS